MDINEFTKLARLGEAVVALIQQAGVLPKAKPKVVEKIVYRRPRRTKAEMAQERRVPDDADVHNATTRHEETR